MSVFPDGEAGARQFMKELVRDVQDAKVEVERIYEARDSRLGMLGLGACLKRPAAPAAAATANTGKKRSATLQTSAAACGRDELAEESTEDADAGDAGACAMDLDPPEMGLFEAVCRVVDR